MKRRLAGPMVGVVVGVLVAGVLIGGAAAPAGAHALLAESSPADGATVPLDKPLSEVILTFTEAVDPLLTVIHVLDASGARVETGKTEVPGAPTKARVPIAPLGPGPYTITWRTTSTADGHTTVGTVAFGVGVPVVAAGADSSGSGGSTGVRSPTPMSIGGRWLFYAGAVLLLGAGVVGVWVVGRPSTVSVWGLNVGWAACALGLVLIIADHMSTGHTSLSNLLASSTGHKVKLQALAVAVAWAAVVWASLRPHRRSLAAVGVGGALVMLERALSGHADASSAPWFTVTVQWLHLVGVGAWIGGLVWLLVALHRRDPGQGRGLARRFSTVALVMLGVVGMTGALRAIDEVGAWSRLYDTSFGVTVLVKIGLFGVLAALGATNRFRHVAAAAAARIGGLRRTVRLEVAVGAAALAATAVLAGLAPSASVAEAEKLQRPQGVTIYGADFATTVRVRMLVSPGTSGPNRFDATVVDYDSRLTLAAERVSLTFQFVDRADVSPSTVTLTRDADKHWRASSSALSQDGRWTVTAVVQTATDSVEVPMELVMGRR